MRRTVPSQVVEFLESRYPSFAEGRGVLTLNQPHRGILAATVALVDRIPTHLLAFTPEEYAQLLEALESMRGAVAVWDAGPTNHVLQPLSNDRQRHPVFVLYRLLRALPDEAVDSDVAATLDFLKDSELAGALAIDVAAVDRALAHAEWKAATVLAGSVIEALLLWAIKGLKTTDPMIYAEALRTAKADTGAVYRGSPERWSLFELIRLSEAGSLITTDTATQCSLAKHFRNLIHPGRAQRLAASCDRGTALASLASIEHVLRDLRAGAS